MALTVNYLLLLFLYEVNLFCYNRKRHLNPSKFYGLGRRRNRNGGYTLALIPGGVINLLFLEYALWNHMYELASMMLDEQPPCVGRSSSCD
ncbi:hypothetical protein DFS33DRAFT_656781 [Desarmillaria ectypa]|nr:hypothetical protein DFS33DRAFT_656781 [Desarmillaria ectypa]